MRARPTLPIVVVIPGIMGSHLWRNQEDRIWFDLTDMVAGGLRELRWTEATGTALGDGISAEKLFDDSYGALCEFLIPSHRVERFPYDWRLPLNLLADRLKQAGIRAHVFNEHASSIVGEVPPDVAQPQVWLERESDRERAQTLLERMEADARAAGTRRCPVCNEDSPGNFDLCWNCGAGL